MAHTISRPTSFKYEELLNNISWCVSDHPNTAKAWKLDNEEDDSETEDIDLDQIVIDWRISLKLYSRYNENSRVVYIEECTIYNILNSIHEVYKMSENGPEEDTSEAHAHANWYVGDAIFFEGISKINDSEWFLNLGS